MPCTCQYRVLSTQTWFRERLQDGQVGDLNMGKHFLLLCMRIGMGGGWSVREEYFVVGRQGCVELSSIALVARSVVFVKCSVWDFSFLV